MVILSNTLKILDEALLIYSKGFRGGSMYKKGGKGFGAVIYSVGENHPVPSKYQLLGGEGTQ